MPNHKSCEKRLKQDQKRHIDVVSTRSGIKSRIKKIETAVKAGDLENARSLFRTTSSYIGRAAHHNILHKNNAARKISRLARMIRKAGLGAK